MPKTSEKGKGTKSEKENEESEAEEANDKKETEKAEDDDVIDVTDDVIITFNARTIAVNAKPEEEVTPVAKAIGDRWTRLWEKMTKKTPGAKENVNKKNLLLLWMYNLAGGTEHNGCEPQKDVLDTMRSERWWGTEDSLFGCTTRERLKEDMEAILPKAGKKNPQTPWVSVSHELRNKIAAALNEHRNRLEKGLTELQDLVFKLDDRVLLLESKDATPTERAATRATEVRKDSIENLHISDYPYPFHPESSKAGTGCLAVFGFTEDGQCDALFSGKRKGSEKREACDMSDPRLNQEMLEAAKLLNHNWSADPKLDLRDDRLAEKVKICQLPVGHKDRRLCRWLADRRINKENVEHSGDFEEMFNEDSEYLCLAGYRWSGGAFKLAATLLYHPVRVGLYIDYVAAVPGSKLGTVLVKMLLKQARMAGQPIITLNSLTGSNIRQMRTTNPEKEKIAVVQDETFDYWSDYMGFDQLTEAKLSGVMRKLTGAFAQAEVPTENIAVLEHLQKRIDMPIDKKCIPMIKYIT